LRKPRKEKEGLVCWTDGARKDDESVGCVAVWNEVKWNKRRVHLGRQKKAFDAEMYAMSEAVKIADEICRENEVRRVMVFTDSKATLRSIKYDMPGPGQALALRMMNWESELLEKNIQVEYQWVPVYKGVEGNEKADQQVTIAAYKCMGKNTEIQNPLKHFDYITFFHPSRKLTELK